MFNVVKLIKQEALLQRRKNKRNILRVKGNDLENVFHVFLIALSIFKHKKQANLYNCRFS